MFSLREDGTREDAPLHEELLRDASGAAAADMEAMAQAVESGVPLENAAAVYAGGAARMLLRKAGLI